MKKMIMATISCVIVLIVIMMGFTIHGRNLKQIELDGALNSSMKRAMEMLLLEDGKPQTEDEWKAMLVSSIAVQLNNAEGLTVKIMEADMKKGILSIEAVLVFQHPIGTAGTVSTGMKTVILEECFTE